MDRGKRLAVLIKIRDGLQNALRSRINGDAMPPEKRSELLSGLASIQREIEFLQRGLVGADTEDDQEQQFGRDNWPEST